MSNISGKNHLIVLPIEDLKKKAWERDKQERIIARSKGYTEKHHDSGLQAWGGYVLEYAVEAVYPHLIRTSKSFGIEPNDFYSPTTKMVYDCKCRVVKDNEFTDYESFFINKDQLDKIWAKKCRVDYIIEGYLDLNEPFIRIAGFISPFVIKKRGRLLTKGGRIKSDCYIVPFKRLTVMASFFG